MKHRVLKLSEWIGLGVLAGVLCGSASALFLYCLQTVTAARVADPRWTFALPVAGLLMGWVYQTWGRNVLTGSNLVLDRLEAGGPQLPLRMAPLALVGTVWSHLFGASVGREGTGVQMGASLADAAAHALKLGIPARRRLLAAGVAGGFGSVFGTPLAGALFGMEVVVAGAPDYSAIVPCLVAALVGDWVTRAWGIQHAVLPLMMPLDLTPGLLLRWSLFAVAIALLAWAFIALSHRLKAFNERRLPNLPLRLFLGGAATIVLWQLLGTDAYLGLSTPLISQALESAPLPAWGFAAKLAFTVVALGFGFIGGEVTPLFVMGALLGSALAGPLGLPAGMAAGVGMAALFAAAANTPLAMILMAAELVGAAVLPHVAFVAVLAWLMSGRASIYTSQRHAFHADPSPMHKAVPVPTPKKAPKKAPKRAPKKAAKKKAKRA